MSAEYEDSLAQQKLVDFSRHSNDCKLLQDKVLEEPELFN